MAFWKVAGFSQPSPIEVWRCIGPVAEEQCLKAVWEQRLSLGCALLSFLAANTGQGRVHFRGASG
jgi:hypothetical protein